jgi:hypothetical protein
MLPAASRMKIGQVDAYMVIMNIYCCVILLVGRESKI